MAVVGRLWLAVVVATFLASRAAATAVGASASASASVVVTGVDRNGEALDGTEVSVDGSPWAAPLARYELVEGTHLFAVRAGAAVGKAVIPVVRGPGWVRVSPGPEVVTTNGVIVSALGKLDPFEVSGRIAGHVSGFQGCYGRARHGRRNLAGRAIVHFVVSPDGSVASAYVRYSTVGDDGMDRCLQAEAQKIEFSPPRPAGFAVLDFTLTFAGERY